MWFHLRKSSRESEHPGRHFSGNNNDLIVAPAPSTEDALVDGRKSNRRGSKRVPHANECKASVIEFYERSNLTVTEFIKKNLLSQKCGKFLSDGVTRCRHPDKKA